MEQYPSKLADNSALIIFIGVALLAIPLMLTFLGGLSSPVPILVCLPIGLGLIMWVSAKETAAKLSIVIFAGGLGLIFVGIGEA